VERSEDHPQVAWLSVTLAALIPLGVAALAAILVAQAGPHEVVLAGVPSDALQSLYVAPGGEATISRDDAIQRARDNVATRGGAQGDAGVRQVALGRYSDNALGDLVRGRLVWVVSFANPDEVASGYIGGGFEAGHSCDCAYHYTYFYVEVDAQTGEFISQAEAAFMDPSRAPGPVQVGNPSSRGYCERLIEKARLAVGAP
jgi:hypothetical protein